MSQDTAFREALPPAKMRIARNTPQTVDFMTAESFIADWSRHGGAGEVVVNMEPGGEHALSRTLELTAPSAGRLHFQGNSAVITSGRRLGNWRTGVHNGVPCWRAPLPSGVTTARQLFVNGRRAARACSPQVSRAHPSFHRLWDVPGQTPSDYLFPMEGGDSHTFFIDPVLMKGWEESEVEVVVLHRWTEERFPVASFDAATGRVVSNRLPVMFMNEGGQWSRFYIENNMADLSVAGTWAFDRRAGEVVYLPLPEEDPAETDVRVATLATLVRIAGPVGRGTIPFEVVFEDCIFEHTDWTHPPGGRDEIQQESLEELRRRAAAGSGPVYAGTPQAAWTVAGAVEVSGAVRCRFIRCTFRHLGGWGLLLGEGCHGSRISRCTFTDLGAGAVHAFGTTNENPGTTNGDHVLEDCEIHSGGHVFAAAPAVLLRHSRDNRICHNHIHDFLYTGISCGWVWGYGNPVARGNLIAHNRIHSLGRGWLSDMGGIYLLGEQPGTVIRNNHIYDIEAAVYGAWGIYLDQGATGVVVESNLVHGPSENAFTIHFGRDNLVRNNVFALTALGLFCIGKGENHCAVVCEGNILLSGGEAFYKSGYKMDWTRFPSLATRRNFLWNARDPDVWLADNMGAWNLVEKKEGQEWQIDAGGQDSSAWGVTEWLSLDDWRNLGHDIESLCADPKFADAAGGDFTLAPDSPALAAGFEPWDWKSTGPRSGA